MRQPALSLSLALLFAVGCGGPATIEDPSAQPEGSTSTDDPTDDPINEPLPEACGPGVCLDEEDAETLAAAAAAFDACIAVDEPDFDNPGELALTTLDLVQTEDGGWGLDVALGEVTGRGNFNYPGFSVETVDGSVVLTAPFAGPDTLPSDRVEQQGYGAAACDIFGGAIALTLDPGTPAKLKLVAWTDLGETVVEELTFTVELPE